MITLFPQGSTARFLQDTPIAGVDLLEAAKDAIRHIPNTAHPARQQLQAAIDLIDLRHAPRRPMGERLAREAEVVGAGLDAHSIEQGEPA